MQSKKIAGILTVINQMNLLVFESKSGNTFVLLKVARHAGVFVETNQPSP